MRSVIVAALAAATIAASPARAGPAFGRVVAFGDSYADIGNVREILAGAGLSALYPAAEYPTGRFSGGTNFVDTIAAAYGVGQDNYAIGGAQAGTGNVAAQGRLPGFRQQWIAFTQGGTTYADLATAVPIAVSGKTIAIPAGGLSFRPGDLAVFSVGGNDARPYRRTGTLEGAAAAADAAAARATEGVDALAARGIRHLVWTAGDVGRLAEAVGKADAPVGIAFSAEYNARMQETLARIARGGTQVAYVDITRIADTANRDPARFGFVDTTSACPAACVGDPALQRRYFFYDDGIHLTSAAFDLVGAYTVNQIDAPYAFRANGDLPRLAAESFARSIAERLDLASGATRPGLSVFGQVSAARDRFRADATSDGYRFRSRGGLGGVGYRERGLLAGAAFAYSRDTTTGAGGDRARARSYQIAGFVAVDGARWFGRAYGGIGWHDVAIRRAGVADPLTASPDARSRVAGARAGWLAPIGGARIGPTVAVAYARGRLGGYEEGGDPAAALAVAAQRSRSLLGSAGIEARYPVRPGIAPWARIAAEAPLAGDRRTVRYAPDAAPGIVNAFAIGRAPRAVSGAAEGGAALALTPRVSVDLAGRARFGRRIGAAASALAGLRVTF